MKKETPRQKIKKLNELNGNSGFYGTHYQFVILIELDLKQRALKILKSINNDGLFIDERLIYKKIYDYLLDGLSIKNIKREISLNHKN